MELYMVDPGSLVRLKQGAKAVGAKPLPEGDVTYFYHGIDGVCACLSTQDEVYLVSALAKCEVVDNLRSKEV